MHHERQSGLVGESGGACPFCTDAFRASAAVARGTVLGVPDAAPVAPGHMLVVPVRHAADFFDMTAQERTDAMAMLDELRARAQAADPGVTGFTIGANCGRSAGQRIPHAHIHFIPRRDGQGPRTGGIKGAVRNRLTY